MVRKKGNALITVTKFVCTNTKISPSGNGRQVNTIRLYYDIEWWSLFNYVPTYITRTTDNKKIKN